MHQSIDLGGPVIWFFYAVSGVAIAGALYQLIDVARRRDVDYGTWGRAVWMPIPLAFTFGLLATLIGGVLGFVPVTTPLYGGFLFVIMIANLVQLPVYLLRVTYPTPRRAIERANNAGESAPDWACDALDQRDCDSVRARQD
ncbi:MAG: hypothetical protein HY876_09515 [Coriobacteriales bacterium]|nr:hypothetical protein [Coriobacteriales bacterium]